MVISYRLNHWYTYISYIYLLIIPSHACNYATINCFKCTITIKHIIDIRTYKKQCIDSVDSKNGTCSNYYCQTMFDYEIPKENVGVNSLNVKNVRIKRYCVNEYNKYEPKCTRKYKNGALHLQCKAYCAVNFCNGVSLWKLFYISYKNNLLHAKCAMCIMNPDPDRQRMDCSNNIIANNKDHFKVLCDSGLCYIRTTIRSTGVIYEMGCLEKNKIVSINRYRSILSRYPGMIMDFMNIGIKYFHSKNSVIYMNFCDPEIAFNSVVKIASIPCNMNTYFPNGMSSKQIFEREQNFKHNLMKCMYCHVLMDKTEVNVSSCYRGELRNRFFDEIICRDACSTYINETLNKIEVVRRCDIAYAVPIRGFDRNIEDFMSALDRKMLSHYDNCKSNSEGICVKRCSHSNYCNVLLPGSISEDGHFNILDSDANSSATEQPDAMPTIIDNIYDHHDVIIKDMEYAKDIGVTNDNNDLRNNIYIIIIFAVVILIFISIACCSSSKEPDNVIQNEKNPENISISPKISSDMVSDVVSSSIA